MPTATVRGKLRSLVSRVGNFYKRTFLFPCLRSIGCQRWIRFGIRYRIVQRFGTLTPGSSVPFEVDFFGLRYKGDLNSHIDRDVYFYGSYERHLLLLLRDIASSMGKPVFADVGANVGQHTLFMASYCAAVHAFEPYPPVRDALEEAVARNELNTVFVHSLGLGAQDGDLLFYAPTGNNLGVGSFAETYERRDIAPSMKLPIVQGDSYFESHAIPSIDIFKIDVEGFERQVLEGIPRMINRSRPVIVMEFSAATRASFSDRNDLMSLLPAGYEAYAIRGNRPHGLFFNHDGYELTRFDFAKGNILLIPREKKRVLVRF